MTKPTSRYNPIDVLIFVARHKMRNGGQSPTLREICIGACISSTGVVSVILDILESDGKIARREDGSSRDISLPGESYIPPADILTML